MSKLIVEVCKIEKIETLENAQNLEMAYVKGWQCLVGKGNHVVGEKVIFVPPDAVMPENLIEQLQLVYLKGNGRIRTVKLRGYISQGLILSTDLIPNYNAKVGDDVAKDLGIIKYEPLVHVSGVANQKSLGKQLGELWIGVKEGKVSLRRGVVKSFYMILNSLKPKKKVNPHFDVYTDLDNVKHYPNVFEEGDEVVITEKIHGTNFRAGVLPTREHLIGRIKSFFTNQSHEFCYGSHRVQKTPFNGKGWYGEDVYGQIAQRYALKDIIPPDYIVYGEIYGPRIQELTYDAKQLEVVFFDVKYKDKYLNFDDMVLFLQERNLPIVPILFRGKFSKETLKLLTEGNTVLGNGKHIREGAVVKPLIESVHNRLGRRILKSISAVYLLSKKKDEPEEFVDDNPEYSH